MFLKIILFIGVVLAAFAAFVAAQPSEFLIARSATMNASSKVIFEQINNFHNWQAWSPWVKLDPAAANAFTGPKVGKDAVFSWSGNNKVGMGTMMIIDSQPSESIKIKLQFLKPFEATNTAEFIFLPEGTQTTVTWSMYGHNNFMAKAMGLIMNCDEMVGGMFDQGLANIKAIVEKSPKK